MNSLPPFADQQAHLRGDGWDAWILALQGDDAHEARRAARRLMEACAAALSPEGLRQNHGRIDPRVAEVMGAIASAVARGDTPRAVEAATRPIRGAVPDDDRRRATWWLCVKAYRLKRDENLSDIEAAERALEAAGMEEGSGPGSWIDAESLARKGRSLRSAIEQFLDLTEGPD